MEEDDDDDDVTYKTGTQLEITRNLLYLYLQ